MGNKNSDSLSNPQTKQPVLICCPKKIEIPFGTQLNAPHLTVQDVVKVNHDVTILCFKQCSSGLWGDIFSELVNFPKLKVLKILLCGLKATDLRALPNNSLSSLYLSDNSLKDEGAKNIASFKTLSTLFIDGNGIGTKGISSLRNLNLQILNISSNRISAEGCKELKKFKNLHTLYIAFNHLNAQAAHQLSKTNNLKILDASHNKIGLEGFYYLTCLTNLQELYVSNNRIGDLGSHYFNYFTKNLYRLCVADNEIQMIKGRFFRFKS